MSGERKRRIAKAQKGARRIVLIPRVRCPACGSTKFKTTRSMLDGGTSYRETLCTTCGERYAVVLQ